MSSKCNAYKKLYCEDYAYIPQFSRHSYKLISKLFNIPNCNRITKLCKQVLLIMFLIILENPTLPKQSDERT